MLLGSFKVRTCLSHQLEATTVAGFGEKTAGCRAARCGSWPLPVQVLTRLVPSALPPSALFLQQCHFLRQAGHSEKAVSLFQAMVDFTFFKPDSVQGLPTKGQVRVLPESRLLSPPLPLLGRGVGNRSWW